MMVSTCVRPHKTVTQIFLRPVELSYFSEMKSYFRSVTPRTYAGVHDVQEAMTVKIYKVLSETPFFHLLIKRKGGRAYRLITLLPRKCHTRRQSPECICPPNRDLEEYIRKLFSA